MSFTLSLGVEQPKIPRNAIRIWGRWPDDGRCNNKPLRVLSGYDHGGEEYELNVLISLL
jgi:hypothetical protein